jgi:hypothetical protein
MSNFVSFNMYIIFMSAVKLIGNINQMPLLPTKSMPAIFHVHVSPKKVVIE